MEEPGISDGQALEKLRRWKVHVSGPAGPEDLGGIIREWAAANAPTPKDSDPAQGSASERARQAEPVYRTAS